MVACSYIWILLGVGQVKQVPQQRPNVVHLMLDPEIRGALWLLPAVIAVALCLSRRYSWFGVTALFVPAVVSMASYAESWAAFKLPGGSAGYSDGWYQSAIYLGACLIPVLAALFNTPPVVEVNLDALRAGRKR